MTTLDHLIPYPLITLIIGGHEPQWVDELLTRVNELDHEMLAMLTGFMIIVARDETKGTKDT